MLAPLGYWATLAAVNGRRRGGEPPFVRGALPFIGVAVRFGKDATTYVQRCQAQHGDVFTLFIAGQRMTFVLDPLSVPAVLKAKQLAFHPISDSVIEHAFGLDGLRRKMDLEAVEALGRTRLRGDALANLTHAMSDRLAEHVPAAASDDWEHAFLYAKVWEVMFDAGTESIFGTGVLSESLRRDFEIFDEQFPLMVTGLPKALFREGEAALRRLGKTNLLGDNASTWILDRQPYIEHLDEMYRALANVPVLFAIHANTIPATFWSLFHLLRHPNAIAAVRTELDMLSTSERQTLDVDTLGKLRVLDSAISEALRLSSGSLTVREVLEPFTLETPLGAHSLRRGDRVCLAPFITHRDPEIFEEPLEYRFDRFHAAGGRKQFYKRGERVPLPLMPFGAGVSMCPGRFFAMNEIKLFIARALTSWDIDLPSVPIPDFEFSRAGLGIYPPAHDVPVRIRRKV